MPAVLTEDADLGDSIADAKDGAQETQVDAAD